MKRIISLMIISIAITTIASASEILQGGPPLYIELKTGAWHSGIGGYLPDGEWRRLMPHNPMVVELGEIMFPKPRYEIWEEQINFPDSELWFFIRHYRVVDESGIAIQKSVFWDVDTHPHFDVNNPQRIIYSSRADINGDGCINRLDLEIFVDDFHSKSERLDVDGNGIVEVDDLTFLGLIYARNPGAKPDEIMLDIMKNGILSSDVMPAPPRIANANNHKAVTWGRLK